VSAEQPDSTDRLIRQLSGDLAPVRRVPPLWMSLGGVVALASALGALFLLSAGYDGGAASLAVGGGPYGAVLLGLGVAGVCGALAALAEGIPGRERVGTVCTWIAVVAFAWGVGDAFSAWWGEGFAPGVGFAADRMCLQKALLLAIVPTLALGLFVVRGWVGRPGRAAVLLLTGGAALGSVAVHLGCHIVEPRHLLVGHLGPTLLWVAVVGAPLAVWLRRRAR
jgi:hypothetical protein